MSKSIRIPACDGYELAATIFEPQANPTDTAVLISAATAVPQRFYQPFAQYLAEQGYAAVTYDYRGIGGSAPSSLRGFEVRARDWALLDMAGVVDWIGDSLKPGRLVHVGHSFGGQTAGLLPNGSHIDAMVTSSAQNGYWGIQEGRQKPFVAFHMHITFPVLSRIVGYLPWSKFGSAEDIPKGVALEWASWCRRRGYLLGDQTLPLERFNDFTAPILAYSFADDGWGTETAVGAMMCAYPNVTQRHIDPADYDIPGIGHFGYFRPKSKALWQETAAWLEQATSGK